MASGPTIELTPDAFGDVTISAAGHCVNTDSDVFRTIITDASNVRLEALTLMGGAPAAIRNGIAGLAKVTIEKCNFSGYTGRTITHGFAEGAPGATNRGSNWKLTACA